MDCASVGPAVSGTSAHSAHGTLPLLYVPGARGPSGASSWGLKEVYLRSLLFPAVHSMSSKADMLLGRKDSNIARTSVILPTEASGVEKVVPQLRKECLLLVQRNYAHRGANSF